MSALFVRLHEHEASTGIGLGDSSEPGGGIETLRFFIRGWFGHDNIGDDAILEVMIDSLKREFPRASIVVVAGHPAEIAERHHVTTISDKMRRSLWLYAKALRRTNVLVIGGGGLLPSGSVREICGFLLLPVMAWVLGVRHCIVYSVGVDPIRSAASRLLMRIGLKRYVSMVSVRDKESAIALEKAGVTKPVSVFPDPALTLNGDDAGAVSLLTSVGLTTGMPYMAVVLGTPFDVAAQPTNQARYETFRDGCADAINKFAAEHLELHVVVIPFDYPGDLVISKDVIERLSIRERVHLVNVQNRPRVARSLIGMSSIALAMRYHAVVFSVGTGTAVVAISYGPKAESLMAVCGIGAYSERFGIGEDEFFHEVRDVDFGSLYTKLEKAYAERNELEVQLKERSDELIQEVRPLGSLIRSMLSEGPARHGVETKRSIE